MSYLSGISRYVYHPNIYIKKVALTPENINEEFKEAHVPDVIDCLSIDVDGMDLWLLESIKGKRIRLLVVEYNASFGPELSLTVPYFPEFDRAKFHPNYHGASLKALTKVASEKGLKLVATENCGINAFFVEKEANVPEVAVVDAYHTHSKRGGTWRDQFAPLKNFEFEEV